MTMYRYTDRTMTLPELRAALPQISLPARPTPETLAPLGVTVIPDPEPDAVALLAEARAVRLAELDAAFEYAQRQSHFCSPALGFEVDATERANRDVAGLITLLQSTGQAATTLCDYGNVMRQATLEQLKTLQLELLVYGQMLYARKWALRTAINSAENAETIRAVEIEFDTLPAPTLTLGAA